MIIKFNGEMTLNKLSKAIKEVAADIQKRAGLNPDTNLKVKDCQIGVIFEVNGEMKYLNVEHEGIKEIFQVNVNLDKKGNIIKKLDNEEKSFQDEYTRNVLKGLKDPSYKEIKSVYSSKDLTFIKEINGGDLIQKTFKHDKTNETVVQYYRNNKLVGEMGYKAKEEA